MKAILILHGPNLNLLGAREPEVYGDWTLDDINEKLISCGSDLGVQVRCFQSNSEGELIDALHDARDWAAGVVFNPGAFTHTSVASIGSGWYVLRLIALRNNISLVGEYI